MSQLILASTSASRKILLQQLQIPFITVGPHIDETPYPNETPETVARRLAQAKAEKVAFQYFDAIIIGSDQVGVLNNEMIGKPETETNAIRQLQAMSGNSMQFFTGICVINTATQQTLVDVEYSTIFFRKFGLTTIKNYLQREDVLNCAGSLKIEGLGITLIEKIVSNDFTAIIGLPLIKLTTMLEQVGLCL